MKRIVIPAVICCIMMTVMIAGSVFASSRRDRTAKPDPNATYDFETVNTVIRTDIFEDAETVFPVMPEGYNTFPTEHKGTIDRLYYETDVYEDGVTYQKYVTVYLPYGYDPEDTEKKYNVLYFQHGNQNSPNQLWDRDGQFFHALQMVNNLFDPDHQAMTPFIIISPTFYFDIGKTTKFIADGGIPAGDGRYEGIPGNYYREIVEDLIPQIESQYNVYCEDFSEEGIKASRDHRAFCGYSRGSCCTWDIFHYDLEYFRYFIPMSANIVPKQGALGDTMAKAAPEEAYNYIYETIAAHPDLDFFLFVTAGGEEDGAGQSMIPQMQEFCKHTDVFSFGTDPTVNNFYFACSEFAHQLEVVPYSWYAAKDILFH